MNGIIAIINQAQTRLLSLPLGGVIVKTAIYDSGSDSSLELASTLIMDFLATRTVRYKYLCI